jgi:hypothetical protein
MEIDHGPASRIPARGNRKTRLVCHALENRDVSQILKSGCHAEESRLRSAERLANLISVFCITSWRIFWLTMLNRTFPDAEPKNGADTCGN